MVPSYFPLRWESTGDQWWYASPIDWAAANGHYELVRELLHLDTNLLIKLTSLRRIRRLETVWDDDEGQFDGIANCRSEVARKLLLECQSSKGHNSLMRAGYGGWLLYTAASAGDVDFINDLVERDSLIVFGEGEYGVTDILYAAARSKNSEVFKLLLTLSIPEIVSSAGEFEFEIVNEEETSVFKMEMMNRAVHAAARGGNVEILKELVRKCSDILIYKDALGSTLLHSASGRGQIEVVKELISTYDDIVNSTDNQGNTALHVAAYRGYLGVVEVLITKIPLLASVTNSYGDSFLHMGVAGFRSPGFHRVDRQMELMKQLVSGEIVNMEDSVNITNNNGRTALHMAVVENIHSDLVELLMTVRGINLNVRDNNGMTPLDLLKQRPTSASSEILIKRMRLAGGISSSQDYETLVSHLKTQGVIGSPGTSFRIPDAEIILYTDIVADFEANCDAASTEYGTYSGETSSPAGKKKLKSVNYAANRLKILLRWTGKKERDDDSLESKSVCGRVYEKHSPISLRERYSKNKRLFSMRNNSSFPSPSAKKKYAAGLMHGVLQVIPRAAVESPTSPFSESSWYSSPFKKSLRDESDEESINGRRSRMKQKYGSFNKTLMNRYFCFGTQALAPEDADPPRPIVA